MYVDVVDDVDEAAFDDGDCDAAVFVSAYAILMVILLMKKNTVNIILQ